jgi:N-acetylneuraminic acid mutarotase
MKMCVGIILLVVSGGFLFAADESRFEPLPAPISNNAVASVKSRGSLLLYSMMGIGAKKTWDATSNTGYMLDSEAEPAKWVEVRSVPGTVGRLGATAVGAREHIFLFGGYVVDAQGGETTLRDVNAYEPLTDRWFRAEDMLVAVDDSVSGLYRERYAYLLGGWSKTDAVRDVQVYDAEKNTWAQATPLPGTPVFGHAGAVVGDTIVYIDGAYKNPAGGQPKYIASDECWMGKIDHHDRLKIQWTKLPNHPGTARYRIAAGGSDKDQKIYFSGGSDNPYNYNGIGYDGTPAEPSPVTFAFNVRTGKWETINEHTPQPTMDHRGMLVLPEGLLIVGGMETGQKVTSRVALVPKAAKAK